MNTLHDKVKSAHASCLDDAGKVVDVDALVWAVAAAQAEVDAEICKAVRDAATPGGPNMYAYKAACNDCDAAIRKGD